MQTPIAFIIFNRPDLTAQVFQEIAKARPPKLFVIADGPRPHELGERDKCAAARAVVEGVDWDCEVVKNYSEVNLGCGVRVATGLEWVFEQTEEAIILEDDCVPHPTFFRFCEELLARYRDDERVMQISGGKLRSGLKWGPYNYFFSRHSNVWGWATWRRAWQLYDIRVKSWPQVRDTRWLEEIVRDPEVARFLGDQFEIANQSETRWCTWDYQWTFACWRQQGLCVHPNAELITNVGCREDGTHMRWGENKFAHIPLEEMAFPLQHPPHVIPHEEADDAFVREVYAQDLPTPKKLPHRLVNKLRQTYAATVPEPVRSRVRRWRGISDDGVATNRMRLADSANASSSV
jgi:hypothetical protein